METLVARRRLGERFWPIPNELLPALKRLAERGLITQYQYGGPGTQQVWINDDPDGPAKDWLKPEFAIGGTIGAGDYDLIWSSLNGWAQRLADLDEHDRAHEVDAAKARIKRKV